MQSVIKYSGRAELAIFALVALAFALLLFAGPAFAGADTTFDTALTKFTDFLEGSGGKIITVLSLAGGIVALASGRFSMGQIAIPVGVGVGAGTGSHRMTVMAVSMDGGPSKDFPNYVVDSGQRARMGVPGNETPALVLFDTQTKRTIPVGYGVLSADEIMDRIFMLTNTKVGSDY